MKGTTHSLPGLVLTDHELQVPLDHSETSGPTIRVYAREVVATERRGEDLPWIVYLQGGPGHGAPRPLERSGWIGRAVDEFRVLLLDQRGTARSTPQSFQTLAPLADDAARANHLKHFRADSIVRDAELLRARLTGGAPWTVLGQSYGGFCLTHYLSFAPEGLAAALFTGGLPPLEAHPDDIYRRTYRHCAAKNRAYYERYPEDVARVHRLVQHLTEHDVRLPGGDRLTPGRLQPLGLLLGFSDGAATVHYLLEEAFVEVGGEPQVSYPFLRGVENALGYDTHPIFSLLHEACYTQGFASDWSAERVRAEFPEFDAGEPFLFTGEMIYRSLFDEVHTLRPLKATAELLAAWDGWPRLYDADRLRANTVPAAAAIYENDMYVDRDYSKETAATIRGLRPWVTDEYEHNGLRADGARILGRLLDLARGRA